MAPSQIRWVPESSFGLTQEQKELEKSAQRAHSARVAHLQRKQKQRNALQKRRSILAQSQPTAPAVLVAHIRHEIPPPIASRSSSDPLSQSEPSLRSNYVLLAFGALPIPHTPEAKRIIAFMRDAYVPCVYIPRYFRQSPDADLPQTKLIWSRGIPGSCGVIRDHQNCIDYPEVQPAWMAGNLSDMLDVIPSSEQPHFRCLMLQCRERGVQILRQGIDEHTKTGSKPSISLLLQIILLLRGNAISDKSQHTQAYAIITHYIEQAHIDQATTLNFLSIVMFNNAELACRRLERTLLDFEFWLANRFKLFWAYAETFLPRASEHVIADLHPSFEDTHQTVRGAICRIRRCLDLRANVDPLMMHKAEDSTAGDLRWAWIASTGLHDMGLLVNHYLNLVEQRDSIEDHNRWNHELNIATTLTTLYSLRKYIHEANCNGRDLREAPLIIQTLEETLKIALSIASPEEIWEARESLLWMYFTGAWHGQIMYRRQIRAVFGDRPTVLEGTDKFDATWFNEQLSKQARALGLTEWSHTEAILSCFAFSNLIRPHPSQWYENVVRIYGTELLSVSSERKSFLQTVMSTTPIDTQSEKT